VAPITYDTPVDGELTNPRESDLYQFEATAGDEIIIEFPAASDTNSSAYRIVDAYGQLVFFDRGLNTSDVISLGLSGTYTLSIEGTIDNSDADVDSYTVNVAFQGNTPVAPLVGTALTLNSDVTGTLAEGEVDSFVFELTERTSIYFDSFTNNSSLRWNLTGPTGTVLSNIPFTSSDAFSGFRVQNLPVGEYQLEVFGLAGATGDYLFRVDSLDSATAITPGTSVSGEFTRAAETDLYQFDANAGDQFFIDILSTSDINNALYRVIDPLGNSVINSNRLNDLDLFTVDLDGTYTLAFEGAVNNTGTDTYEFLLQPVTATTAALTLGQLTTGNIDVAGDVDSYTFEVTEFGSFFVDTLNFESDLRFSVTDQNGVRQGNSFGFTGRIHHFD